MLSHNVPPKTPHRTKSGPRKLIPLGLLAGVYTLSEKTRNRKWKGYKLSRYLTDGKSHYNC